MRAARQADSGRPPDVARPTSTRCMITARCVDAITKKGEARCQAAAAKPRHSELAIAQLKRRGNAGNTTRAHTIREGHVAQRDVDPYNAGELAVHHRDAMQPPRFASVACVCAIGDGVRWSRRIFFQSSCGSWQLSHKLRASAHDKLRRFDGALLVDEVRTVGNVRRGIVHNLVFLRRAGRLECPRSAWLAQNECPGCYGLQTSPRRHLDILLAGQGMASRVASPPSCLTLLLH